MKKLLVSAVLALGLLGTASAEENILFKLGAVNVLVPFSDVSATYLFDGVAKQSLVGAETPLIEWHNLQMTGGAVTSIEGEGSPFIGINLSLTNPADRWVNLGNIHPGIFGGRNFNNNEWMAGVKATVSIFN